jgi:ABC-type branched-subunit amino acid transport system ATPase component
MTILEASEIVSGYGGTEILHGVSIVVARGEIVTVIGPNGSGKSTLLKTILGLLRPTQGVVRFKNEDITGMAPEVIVRKGVCYVPQSDNIFPSLSIHENLEMGAFVRVDDYSHRLDEIYGLFPDLAARSRGRAGKLSGGQRQMLALARALMLDPEVVLLDEPSAGLAPNMVSTVLDTIVRINETGVAIVLVEQNARAALKLSSRGYVLASGQNRLEARAEDLLQDPKVARLYLGGR